MQPPMAKGELIPASTYQPWLGGLECNAEGRFGGEELVFSVRFMRKSSPRELDPSAHTEIEISIPAADQIGEYFRQMVSNKRHLLLFDGEMSIGEVQNLTLFEVKELADTQARRNQILRSVVATIARFTFPYVAGIYGEISDDKGELWASGVRVLTGLNRKVISAPSVFSEGVKKYRRLAISTGTARRPHPVIGAPDVTHGLSIYNLPIDYPVQRDASLAFWPSDRFGKILPEDLLFVHGYHLPRSSFDTDVGGVKSRSFPYVTVQVPLLNGTTEDFALMSEPNLSPQGLIGSPVWTFPVPRREGDVKPSSLRLAGIVTEVHQNFLIARSLNVIGP